MELTSFCHFLVPCWYSLLCCVPRRGHWDLLMPRTSVSAFPPWQFPLPAPCRSFPHVEERSLYAPSLPDMQEQLYLFPHILFIRE